MQQYLFVCAFSFCVISLNWANKVFVCESSINWSWKLKLNLSSWQFTDVWWHRLRVSDDLTADRPAPYYCYRLPPNQEYREYIGSVLWTSNREYSLVHCHCAFKCLSTLRGGGCPAERSQVGANRPVCHPPPTARSPITIIMTPPVRAHIAQLETTDTPDHRAQDSPSLTTYTHLSESRPSSQSYREKGNFVGMFFFVS